jgi:integrase
MKLRQTTINGKPGWCLDYGKRDGQRRRKCYLDPKEAQKALRDAQRDAREIGRRWHELPPVQRADTVAILAEIESKGLTLRAVWDAFQHGSTAKLTGTKTLGEAIDELIEAKEKKNLRPVYLARLAGYLRRFAEGREAKSISSVNIEEVEQFINAGSSVGSRATIMNRIGTLFSFAVRRGWCASNPTWLALALFAGIRPEEADRLSWNAIDLERGIVTLDAPGSKVRRRRIIHLKRAALAWLKLGGDLPLPQVTRRRCLRQLREFLGWQEWKKDVLRHTAASMWLATDPDPARVSMKLGNSLSVLFRSYRELVKEPDARLFWSLTPDLCGCAEQ